MVKRATMRMLSSSRNVVRARQCERHQERHITQNHDVDFVRGEENCRRKELLSSVESMPY
eukprot:57986-Amorphochlora_amoeboformis.AAC.1